MSKTIEDAAKKYAKYRTDEVGYGSMEEYQTDKMIYYDEAVAVLSWLFVQPLSERLNEAEKATLLMIYAAYRRVDMDDSPFLPAQRVDEASAKIELLESIFGKEMFNEPNQEK